MLFNLQMLEDECVFYAFSNPCWFYLEFCNVVNKPDENNVGAEGCDYHGSMVLYFLEQ